MCVGTVKVLEGTDGIMTRVCGCKHKHAKHGSKQARKQAGMRPRGHAGTRTNRLTDKRSERFVLVIENQFENVLE